MQLRPEGFNGFKLAELTPNKTRRAQCANWLLYYREALFGVKLLRDGTITLASDVAFTAKLLTFGVSPTSSTGFVTFYRATTAAMCGIAARAGRRPSVAHAASRVAAKSSSSRRATSVA